MAAKFTTTHLDTETWNNDALIEDIINMLVDKHGINMCSIRDIAVTKQEDGQITNILVDFIPSDSETSVMEDEIEYEVANVNSIKI